MVNEISRPNVPQFLQKAIEFTIDKCSPAGSDVSDKNGNAGEIVEYVSSH